MKKKPATIEKQPINQSGEAVLVSGTGNIRTSEDYPVQSPTGARRGTDLGNVAYTLLPYEAIRRYAEVMAEGRDKYGEYNWEKGFAIRPLLEHAIEHIFKYLDGDRGEDHLGHALWNIGAAVTSEVRWPELNFGEGAELRPVQPRLKDS